jgi:hypothetical protein
MSDLSPQAQRLMQLTREALSPDEAAVAALRAALEARLGPAPTPTAPHADAHPTLSPGAALMAKSPLLKLAGVALIVGSVALSLVVFGFRDRRGPAASATSNVPQPVAAARSAVRNEPATSPAADAAPTASPAPTALPLAAAGARRKRPSRRLAHDAARPSDLTQPKRAHAPQSTLQPPAAEPDDSLGPELALMREARAALDRHNPQAALALLEQHAQRYPRGTLQQERLAAQALAQCALGRDAAAIASVRELTRVAPGSPYLARVRAGCNAERSK